MIEENLKKKINIKTIKILGLRCRMINFKINNNGEAKFNNNLLTSYLEKEFILNKKKIIKLLKENY